METSQTDPGLRVGRAEIGRMVSAAAVVRDCERDLAARDGGLIGRLVGEDAPICDWRHYPAGEVYDSASHAQYFFHAHPDAKRRVVERGHFHTFLRAEGMPAGVMPMLFPELAVADVAPSPPQAAPLKRGARDEVSHLIAIAIDERGTPVRLFTTNRWVTGETWYRAEDVIQMLDHFVIGEETPPRAVNRWLCAIIQLFRPQIVALLRTRDETVMAWRRRRRSQVLEDSRLEVTSSLDIDLASQLAFIDDACCGAGEVIPRGRHGLPPMAEGWE